MTYTIVIFAWRKSGLTPAQFKHHYETVHVPLIQSLTGSTFPLTHTRHYLSRVQAESAGPEDSSNAAYKPVVFFGDASDFDYDAYSELVFEDEAKFQEFFALFSKPEVAGKIGEDEGKFIERSKLKIVGVDEACVTSRG